MCKSYNYKTNIMMHSLLLICAFLGHYPGFCQVVEFLSSYHIFCSLLHVPGVSLKGSNPIGIDFSVASQIPSSPLSKRTLAKRE